MPVTVVGAGVIGLTVGVRLAEAGHQAEILARDLPLETTSAIAAAIWYPYLIQPLDRALRWCEVSRQTFVCIAAREQEAGVVMRAGTELLRKPGPEPWWGAVVPGLSALESVPAPYRQGWAFETPVVDMPVYLGWLAKRFAAAGGTLTRRSLSRLPGGEGTVVNCSGLGARSLVADRTVSPVRGQVVRVGQVGLERWLLDGAGLTYVVPRANDIVVGGTEDAGEWDTTPDAAVAAAILDRARSLVPELQNAPVLSHRVGLRPTRPTVRLETETAADGGRIVHCYGHGGAGVTVSWGCAEEVLALVERGAGRAGP